MEKIIFILLFVVLITGVSFSVNAQVFNKAHANFSIVYNDFKIPLQRFSIFVMPKEAVEIYIAEENRDRNYSIELGGGTFTSRESFKWQAPSKSGYYPVVIRETAGKSRASEIKLNVFVLQPWKQKNGSYLNGFKIGNYPQIPANKSLYYSRPEGFLKIEKSLLDLKLSPHFKMRQFLTNQTKEFPQYIVLKETLLLKLEYFLAEVNKAGYKAETFGIVSAYRTPYFNKKIGNNSSLSRHIFGDAADIYIDNKDNNWMDDLNGDGQSNLLDANLLFNLAKKFDKNPKYSKLQGGLASYKGNGLRGPFIHIDTRGFHVSW